MAKSNRESGGGRGPAPERSSLLTPGMMGLTTLVGVGVVIALSLKNGADLKTYQAGLSDRIGNLETRLTQISAKIDSGARPARAGEPDPNRVVTVKTEGAPVEGPKDAPVTIAEFSDFQ